MQDIPEILIHSLYESGIENTRGIVEEKPESKMGHHMEVKKRIRVAIAFELMALLSGIPVLRDQSLENPEVDEVERNIVYGVIVTRLIVDDPQDLEEGYLFVLFQLSHLSFHIVDKPLPGHVFFHLRPEGYGIQVTSQQLFTVSDQWPVVRNKADRQVIAV